MQKKRTLKKILFFAIVSIIILAACITPSIPLKFCEGISILIVLFFMTKYYEKEFELENLTTDYNSQKQIMSDIFKYCPDLIFYKDKNLKYLGCNKAFVDVNDVETEQDVINKTDFDLLASDDALRIKKHDYNVLKTKKAETYQLKIFRKKEGERIYEVIKAPLNFGDKTIGVLGIARDITENTKLQNSLLEKQAQLKSILDSMPFIAYLKNIEEGFTIGNSNFNDLINSPENSNNILTLSDICMVDTTDKINDEDLKIIENKETYIVEKEIETQKGKLWLEIHKAPIFDKQQGVSGIVVMIKNITSDKEIQDQKETFIATLTHDLKTPTSAQIRALSLLLNESFGELKKEQKEIIEQTLNSCKYMFNMISSILSTYKKEYGNTSLKFETFDLKQLIQESKNEITYLAKEKGQTITTNFLAENNEVSADKTEIKKVIINLLSNAISYTRTNSEIEILLRETQNNILFEIKNSSNYISKDDLAKLFDKYLSNTSFRQVGTGIGLYLSKQIIKDHGGTMITENEKNIGKTFGFIIPKTGIRNKTFNDLTNHL